MSFVEQERALLDLLFDAERRRAFTLDHEAALAAYELSTDERADFESVRLDALEIDASMRCDLILQHMCQALPVSFSIASSLPNGLVQLRTLIDTAYVRALPSDRAALLGRRLRAWLVTCAFANELEQAAAIAICDAELSMAITAGSLRESLLSGADAATPTERAAGWVERPLALASHVSVALLSQSYAALKRALCPVADAELWPRLSTAPLPATRRSQTLAHKAPRLLVTRAHAVRSAACEITVDQRTLELSPGFGPLLSHLDGKVSLAELLRELRKAGAQESVCQGVQAGFEKLIDTGMVV